MTLAEDLLVSPVESGLADLPALELSLSGEGVRLVVQLDVVEARELAAVLIAWADSQSIISTAAQLMAGEKAESGKADGAESQILIVNPS